MKQYVKPVYVVPIAAWIGCAFIAQTALSGLEKRQPPTEASIAWEDRQPASETAQFERQKAPAVETTPGELGDDAANEGLVQRELVGNKI